MARKRKTPSAKKSGSNTQNEHHEYEDLHNDSQDEFYTARDKILVDEGPVAKRQRRTLEQDELLQASDEEVFEFDESESDNSIAGDFEDQDLQDLDAGKDDSDNMESYGDWGSTKAEYYNADNIENEDDALEEEKEAKRLQQKQLKGMKESDFGFDEFSWKEPELNTKKHGLMTEKLPEARIPLTAVKAELVKMLYGRYPEFHPLALELEQLQTTRDELVQQLKDVSSKNAFAERAKLSALTSYLGSIVMYFAVLTSNTHPSDDVSVITSIAPLELRGHAVIESIVSSKRAWDKVKDFKFIPTQINTTVDSSTALPVLQQRTEVDFATRQPEVGKESSRSRKKSLSSLQQEIDQSDVLQPADRFIPKRQKVDLQSLLKETINQQDEEESDFGDEDPLTTTEAAEKASRKKSLRFYGSQIRQKANKRGAASREAGGDDDVPRKERLRDKQDRLLREAEKRGNERPTEEERLNESDRETDLGNEADDYYASLADQSNKRKAQRKAKAEAYEKAAADGAVVHEEEQVGTDGKRKITYAIEKNKGLAPKRKKDVRNPRVKKRKKFDEKMKKLGSMRQVYKGGEGRGGYGGELTGIKTNLVKSIKLS